MVQSTGTSIFVGYNWATFSIIQTACESTGPDGDHLISIFEKLPCSNNDHLANISCSDPPQILLPQSKHSCTYTIVAPPLPETPDRPCETGLKPYLSTMAECQDKCSLDTSCNSFVYTPNSGTLLVSRNVGATLLRYIFSSSQSDFDSKVRVWIRVRTARTEVRHGHLQRKTVRVMESCQGVVVVLGGIFWHSVPRRRRS